MNRDRLDNELRSKLDNVRMDPPSDMWSRIAATLEQKGLTAEDPQAAPAVRIRRPRRLRLGFAAAAAVILCLVVFGPRLIFTDEPVAPVDAPEILTPDQIADLIGKTPVEPETAIQDPVEGVREAVRERVMPSSQTNVVHHTLVAQNVVVDDPVSQQTVTTVDNTVEETPQATTNEQKTAAESTSVTGNNKTTRTNITSDRGRVPVDRSFPIAEDRRTNRRAAPLGVAVFSNNLGGLSTEKISTNAGKLRAQSNDLIVNESSASAATLMNSKKTSAEYTLKHKMPFSGGISFSYGLTDRLAIESGLTYTYMVSEGESVATGSGAFDIKQKLHYMGIPVGVKYDIIQARNIDLYASANAHFEVLVSGKRTKTMTAEGMSGVPDREKIKVDGVQPSLGAHLGAEIKLTNTLGLYVEPGVSYYFETKHQPDSYRTEHPFNFSLRAGLRINLR